MLGLFIYVLFLFIVVFGSYFPRLFLNNKIDNIKYKMDLKLIDKNYNFDEQYRKKTNTELIDLKDKALNYHDSISNIKIIFGYTGIALGVMGMGLTVVYFIYTRNIDSFSDILNVLHKKDILTQDQFDILFRRNQFNSNITSGITLFSGVSQLFLLSITVYDLFASNNEKKSLNEELKRKIDEFK